LITIIIMDVAATTTSPLEWPEDAAGRRKENIPVRELQDQDWKKNTAPPHSTNHNDSNSLIITTTKKRLHEDFITVGPKKACLLHDNDTDTDTDNNDDDNGNTHGDSYYSTKGESSSSHHLNLNHHRQHSLLMHVLLLQGKKGVASNLSRAIAENGSIQEILHLFQHYLFHTSRIETFALDLLLAFWKLFPESAQEDVLPLFARFECWQQLLLLMKLAKKSNYKGASSSSSSLASSPFKKQHLKKRVYTAVLGLFKEQWEKDSMVFETHECSSDSDDSSLFANNNNNSNGNANNLVPGRPSSMALWLPRERGKWDRELDFVRRFSRILYPKAKQSDAKAMYRKELESLCELRQGLDATITGCTCDTTTTTTTMTAPTTTPQQQQQQQQQQFLEVERTALTSRWKPTALLFSIPTLIRLPATWKQRFLHTHTAIDTCDYVTLPRTGRIDEYFMGDAVLTKVGEAFLQKGTRHFKRRRQSEEEQRVLYIHQGEVGHATSDQCDVIVSDRATTCHVLAIRSESHRGGGGRKPSSLTSLAHIDASFYDDCVQSMVEAHISHHNGDDNKNSTTTTATTTTRNNDNEDEDEKRSENGGSSQQELIDIQIHICGGFKDDRNSSHQITEWLLHLLAWLADEYKDTITMTLATCVLSSMNDTGYSAPVGRGMGIYLRTGEAFLAKVDGEICGPAQLVRNARIWTPGDGTLNVVHTAASNDFVIKPFQFHGCSHHEELLQLPDHKMILKTSTSPDVEESDFCLSVRNTLRFMREVKSSQVFGPGHDETLVFRRVGKSNSWKRVPDV
jgi:hypothetical protein